MTIEQIWVENLRSLPPDQQQEALNFVEFLESQVKKQAMIAQTLLYSLRNQQLYRAYAENPGLSSRGAL